MELGGTRQRALLIALLASLVLWNLPFGGVVLYPFKILATWLHEMSHGLTMLFSGVGFDHLDIYRDSSGIAEGKTHANAIGRAFISSAGYVGTAAFGAIFLVIGQTWRGARSVLGALAAALVLSAFLWLGNDFGIAVVLIGAAALLGTAFFASEKVAVFLVNFIAAQACAHALLDIRVLFRSNLVVNGRPFGASDAHNMAASTFGSPWLWASVWLLWSLLLFYVALRIVYLRQLPASATERTV